MHSVRTPLWRHPKITLILSSYPTAIREYLSHHWLLTLIELVFVVLAGYWWKHLPVPGYAIGAVSFIAAVLSIRIDREAGVWERAVWMGLIGAFLIVELLAIRKDRTDYANAEAFKRSDENQQFQKIANGLKQDIQQNQEQFQLTMQQAGQILQSTREVGKLAEASLENITGGDSFAIVTPQVWSGLVPIPLSVRNYGKQSLTGISVMIIDSKSWDMSNPRNFYESSRVNVGTLHAGELRLLTETLTPIEGQLTDGQGTKMVQYDLYISAQNFTAEEHLVFKRGKRLPWVFRYNVVRQFVKSQTKNKTTFGYKLLSKTDWTGE
jgi:hypothetical protein